MDFIFPLIKRTVIAKDTMEFTLDTSSANYLYKAGQNADFVLLDPPFTDELGNTRTFSFVSSPDEKMQLRFATRMRNSAFKKSIKTSENINVKVSQPLGQFTLPKDPKRPVIFLAGGIGITPFMSMISWASNNNPDRKIVLLYSNKNIESSAYLKELDEYSKKMSNFTFVPTLTRQTPLNWKGELGKINKQMVAKYTSHLEQPIYYSAGPIPMTKSMVEILEEIGVPEEHIKTEEFLGYE